MEMADKVIQSILQMRQDRGTQVPNAGDDGNATVEVAARDDSKIRYQVSSFNVSVVVIPTHPLDCDGDVAFEDR
jgi:hypothetical protein